MRSTAGHLTCTICGHQVNPRSERCDNPHPLCTTNGCEPAGVAQIAPLAGVAQADLRSLAALPATPTRLVDVASYQAGINLAAVRAAGYGAVNIKTSQGTWYQFGAGPVYAEAARILGMGVSAFHWLDNSASGAEQARYAYQRYTAMGAQAMQCDNEDTSRAATYAITRDFVAAWADLAGHLPYMYTGDWWATDGSRAGWNVHALTPWLMAPPNAGYLGSYPGDDSPHWHAGYWGYGDLSLMQYAVSPIGGAGGGDLSKTAIRDPAVWAAITGGDDMALTDEDITKLLNAAVPASSPGMDSRPLKIVFADIWLALTSGRLTGGELWPSSPLVKILTGMGQPVDVALGDEQLAALADRIGTHLVASPDTPLGDADKPAIVAAVKEALGGLTLRAQ